MLVFMIPGQFQNHSVIGSEPLTLRSCTVSKLVASQSPHGPLINVHDVLHKTGKEKEELAMNMQNLSIILSHQGNVNQNCTKFPVLSGSVRMASGRKQTTLSAGEVGRQEQVTHH